MKRKDFLRKFGIGLAVAPVAPALVAKALEPTPAPAVNVGKGLLAMIEEASTEQTYTVWTGSEGMKAFDQAMKDYVQNK